MIENIILGGGCFWCMEAIFQRVKGVNTVISGYSGGQLANPAYEQVCNGESGHAEVIKLEFDISAISLKEILDIFWHLHDPTTPNRQGADVGTQYRSIVFYNDKYQKQIIENSLTQAQADWKDPIVTEIKPLDIFYPAE